MRDKRDRQSALKKLMTRCHPSRGARAETVVAAGLIAKFIQETKPTMWRWPTDTRTLVVGYSEWTNRTVKPEGVTEGKLKAPYLVKHGDVTVWSALRKGYIGVLVKNTLLLLPADSAEPMW